MDFPDISKGVWTVRRGMDNEVIETLPCADLETAIDYAKWHCRDHGTRLVDVVSDGKLVGYATPARGYVGFNASSASRDFNEKALD